MKKLYSLLIIQLFLCSLTSNLSWGLASPSTFQEKHSSNNRITKLSTQAKILGSKVATSLNRNKNSILQFTFLLTFSCLTLTFFGLSAFIAFGMISLPSYAFYTLIVLGSIVSIPFILGILSRAYNLQKKINNSNSSSYSKKIHPLDIFFLIISIINILSILIISIFSILFFNKLLSVAVGATLIGASILMALLLTASIAYPIAIVLISTIRANKEKTKRETSSSKRSNPERQRTANYLSEVANSEKKPSPRKDRLQLWNPITQVVSNIIFLSVFTCSVLMILNIIPLASLSPVAFSFLPYLLISISLLFHFVNCISFFVKKYKEFSNSTEKPMIFSHLSSKKNTLSLALIVIQTLVYLGGASLILIFYTFFSTMTLPIFVATSAYILALLTVAPLFYLSIASYKYRPQIAELDPWHEPIKVSIKKIKNNIRWTRYNLYKSTSEPEFFSDVYSDKPLPGNMFLKYLERKKRKRKFMSFLDDHLSKQQEDAVALKERYKTFVESLHKAYSESTDDYLSIKECLALSPGYLIDKHYRVSETELPTKTILDKLDTLNTNLLNTNAIKTKILNLQKHDELNSSS